MFSTRSSFSFILLSLIISLSTISAAPIPTTTTAAAIPGDCWYVGTFFKLINCNAPAGSTKIPYAPEVTALASPVAAAVKGGKH